MFLCMNESTSHFRCILCKNETKRVFKSDDYEGKIFFNQCPYCKGDLILETIYGIEKQHQKMSDVPQKELEEIIRKYYTITAVSVYPELIIFEVEGPSDASSFYDTIVEATLQHGYVPLLRREKTVEKKEKKVILCTRKNWTDDLPKKRVTYGLLSVTVLTTFIAGLTFSWNFYESMFERILGALSFSGALLLILGMHELGHKRAANMNKVLATNPYFIPAPPLISIFGTFGAIIKVKSPVPNRNAAIELGAAGPLLSFALSIPMVILGTIFSKVVSKSSTDTGGILFQLPIIMILLFSIFAPQVNAGEALLLHPIAFAGWIGIFVTAINLFPVGQLDAGHVSRANLGEKGHLILTQIVIVFLLVLGIFLWTTWIVWSFLLLILSRNGHPGSLDDISPISRRNKVISVLLVIIFFLSFTPVPVKFV